MIFSVLSRTFVLSVGRDNVKFREYKKDNKSEKDLKNSVMTGLMGNLGEYIYKGVRGIGHILWTQIKTK